MVCLHFMKLQQNSAICLVLSLNSILPLGEPYPNFSIQNAIETHAIRVCFRWRQNFVAALTSRKLGLSDPSDVQHSPSKKRGWWWWVRGFRLYTRQVLHEENWSWLRSGPSWDLGLKLRRSIWISLYSLTFFYILVQERDRESTLFSPSVPGIARLNWSCTQLGEKHSKMLSTLQLLQRSVCVYVYLNLNSSSLHGILLSCGVLWFSVKY